MTATNQEAAEAVRQAQGWLRNQRHWNERWFSGLELVSATVTRKAMTVVMRDPADGRQHGWRFDGGDPDSIDWLLDPDLVTGLPDEPDENGIRWWQTQGFHRREATLSAAEQDEVEALAIIGLHPHCTAGLVNDTEALARVTAARLIKDDNGLVLTEAGERRLRHLR